MKRQWDHCLPNIMKVLEDFIAQRTEGVVRLPGNAQKFEL